MEPRAVCRTALGRWTDASASLLPSSFSLGSAASSAEFPFERRRRTLPSPPAVLSPPSGNHPPICGTPKAAAFQFVEWCQARDGSTPAMTWPRSFLHGEERAVRSRPQARRGSRGQGGEGHGLFSRIRVQILALATYRLCGRIQVTLTVNLAIVEG